jgi:hypothetical protein
MFGGDALRTATERGTGLKRFYPRHQRVHRSGSIHGAKGTG